MWANAAHLADVAANGVFGAEKFKVLLHPAASCASIRYTSAVLLQSWRACMLEAAKKQTKRSYGSQAVRCSIASLPGLALKVRETVTTVDLRYNLC